MKSFYNDLKLGILGGGQLGRMLIQEAINYNVTIKVLDPDSDAPCKNICDKFVVGSLTHYETVYNFGKNCDLITIEIEKVNTDALQQLEDEGKIVYPQARVIRLIQDKSLQKEFFKQNDIPSAAFRLISSKENLLELNLPFPYIQKLRRDGYDGRGVKKILTQDDALNSFDEATIVEEWIDFEKELSVIVARNDDGEVRAFPCVEMEFNPEANLVEYLISPSTYDFEVLQRAQQIAISIAEKLKIVGVLAVELFLTVDGNILVNEIAPRPHNSGHQSIEGNYTSQFNQHLRAIFNLPLGDTSSIGHAVMINLLGEKGHEGPAKYDGLEKVLNIEGAYVHLYGKKLTKPYRKMGHVTVVGKDREETIQKARLIQQTLKVIA